jgi:hypothetical protein
VTADRRLQQIYRDIRARVRSSDARQFSSLPLKRGLWLRRLMKSLQRLMASDRLKSRSLEIATAAAITVLAMIIVATQFV